VRPNGNKTARVLGSEPVASTYDIYARISDEGERTKAKVAEQLDIYEVACREWAEQASVEIGEVARETDVSGAAPVDQRELGRLIKRVESGESAGILTPYLDRFGRDTIEGCLAYRRIKKAGGRLVCVNDGIDSDRDGDETIFQVRMVFAEDYLRRVKANFQSRIQKAAAEGIYLASRAPLGYLRKDESDPVRNSRGEVEKDGRLVRMAEAKPLIREVFLRRAQGASARELRDYLRRAGAELANEELRKRFTPISVSGVQHVLRNRAYLGEATVQNAAKGQPDVIPNAHEPMVTHAEWERAQAAGGTYHPPTGRWSSRTRLSGIVQCANGHRLKVSGGRSTLPEEKRKPLYACTRDDCDARIGIDAERLDNFIRGLLEDAVYAEEPHVIAILQGDDRYQRALAAVEAAREEMETFIAEVKVTDIGKHAWVQGKEARQAALDQARAELRAIPAPKPAKNARGKPITFDEALPGLEREHIARFIDRVVVKPVGRGKRVPVSERAELWLVGAETALDPATVQPVGDPETMAILAAAHPEIATQLTTASSVDSGFAGRGHSAPSPQRPPPSGRKGRRPEDRGNQ
jgi:DNA invertase Pin-like site-specific DNA recombinase